MEQPHGNPIATRTRSQKLTTEHSPPDEKSSAEHQEINEDFLKLNIDNNEVHQQQLGDNMEQIVDNINSSLSIPISNKNDEMKNEQLNNHSYSNVELQHLQEIFTMELAQKQKIIEEQQQLLLQLKLNIQELMEEKQKQHYYGISSQAMNYNNNLPTNSNSLSLPQMEPIVNHNRIENNTSKYDNFIEQQLLKDKINNIRKFSGNKYDDVDEWVQNIEHDFPSTLVSEEIKLKLIPKSLTNDAKNWFEQNKHRLPTWKIFKMEIQHRFQSSLHCDQKFIRLRERKQQSKETGQQFIDAMEKLCFQVNPSMMEQEKMLHIKAGLKPSLKEKVFDKQPQSMHELRNTIKRTEDIEVMLNDGNNNENQIEQPTFSSNLDQPSQYDSNCYALPSHYNNSFHYRRRNNHYYQHPQQQEMIEQKQQSNQYQSRNKYNQHWNQHQSNYGTSTNSYSTTTPNNNQKKY